MSHWGISRLGIQSLLLLDAFLLLARLLDAFLLPCRTLVWIDPHSEPRVNSPMRAGLCTFYANRDDMALLSRN